MNNCDVWALERFLNEFKNTSLLPKRENIFIIATQCKQQKNCFCDLVGTDKPAHFDIFVEELNNEKFNLFAKSTKGKLIIEKIFAKKIKEEEPNIKIRLNENNKFDLKEISEIINDRKKIEKIFNEIANNCFGCGACSAVCPLCFCTRQEFSNFIDNEGKDCNNQCLSWDSCFSKRFSEIQHHYNFRPNISDRFYNWYHHKFVRSIEKNNYPLCVGCGRCIDACPANLNIKNILETIINKNETYSKMDSEQN